MTALVALHEIDRAKEWTARAILLDPDNINLLYNLGCNGVGFLPSVAGGLRIARLIRGDELPPSIFDPATTAPGATRVQQ